MSVPSLASGVQASGVTLPTPEELASQARIAIEGGGDPGEGRTERCGGK
jgi:hypothetical protein